VKKECQLPVHSSPHLRLLTKGRSLRSSIGEDESKIEANGAPQFPSYKTSPRGNGNQYPEGEKNAVIDRGGKTYKLKIAIVNLALAFTGKHVHLRGGKNKGPGDCTTIKDRKGKLKIRSKDGTSPGGELFLPGNGF